MGFAPTTLQGSAPADTGLAGVAGGLGAAVPPLAGMQRARGRAAVRFAGERLSSRVVDLYQSSPCRILLPRPAPADPATAVLATTCGGLTGGDRIEIEVEAKARAAAMVTGQSAEKIYRSLGDTAEVEIGLSAGPGAWLEWLPQETILFDGARLARTTTIAAAPDARVLAGEILVLGRALSGETVTRGAVRDSWRVSRGDRLTWADAFAIEESFAELATARAGLDGAAALATVVLVSSDAPMHLDGVNARLRDLEGGGVRTAAAAFDDLLLVRILARDGFGARGALAGVWRHLRVQAGGMPARMPSLFQA